MNEKDNSGARVEIRSVRKAFNGQPVLHGVDLTVAPGEIFVIMGPSGSGKSVLLRHVIGLETPDAGEVLINGEIAAEPGTRDHCRMAMVFQGGALLNSLTLAENVGLYLREHNLKPEPEIEAVVKERLALVGLEEARDKLPAELSGGMRKRAAIARALVMEPQLLLYDEPTSELDPLMASTVGREIVNLRRRHGVTSMVVSHDRDLAFGIADRMALIRDGRILCQGTPGEVRASDDAAVKEFLNANLKHEPESPEEP
ncbi:MAG: ABC transporter ATP-binding protein [Verrucomicrobiales bacterium]|nr:ABC transporter ATP-binding protein [Verrucomicrobiales bacterium]